MLREKLQLSSCFSEQCAHSQQGDTGVKGFQFEFEMSLPMELRINAVWARYGFDDLFSAMHGL